MATHTITITDPDQTSVTKSYVFSDTTYTSPTGDSGSYTYTKTSGSKTEAQLQLVSVFAQTLTYQLTFTSSSGGTYVDQSSKAGTFTYK